MPRTLEQIVQEQLGGLQFALCSLQAENEKLRARVTELEAKEKKPDGT